MCHILLAPFVFATQAQVNPATNANDVCKISIRGLFGGRGGVVKRARNVALEKITFCVQFCT